MNDIEIKKYSEDIYPFYLRNRWWVLDFLTGEVMEIETVNEVNAEKLHHSLISLLDKRHSRPLLDTPGQKDAKRLELQGQVTCQVIEDELSYLHLEDTKDLLEVGSGTGVFTQALIAKIKPDTKVIGVDINPLNLKIAAMKLPMVNFIQADAEKLPFYDDSFDCVISKLFFNQLSNPANAIKEMIRVTRNSGQIIAIDTDEATLCYPEPTKVETRLHKAYREYLNLKGMDCFIGRKLKDYFRKEYISNICSHVIPQSYFGRVEDQEIIRTAVSYLYLYKNIEKDLYHYNLISPTDFNSGLKALLTGLDEVRFQMTISVLVMGRVRKNA